MAKPRKRIANAVKRICVKHGAGDNLALRKALTDMIQTRIKRAVGHEKRLHAANGPYRKPQ